MNPYDPSGHSVGAVAVLDNEHEVGIRADKIRDIRRQLGERRYRITDKIDVVIDKLLDALRR